ncbi:valine--pyruvate transaminase [Verrucomicrobium sp. BvORR034]|uniref:valine--pyruvate transaminase n=1 Tax=Verrucomicrobium sp. BvORR034 TaxID=1396418 RepID=UPI000679C18D|nr:valine--pyruvate transaminase [Verrucomicrobium sp. BvORR034]
MTPPYSDVGLRLSGSSGIQELMDDLGISLTTHPDMRMLGGGQPAAIPAVQALWRERMEEMVADGTALDRMLLNYDPPTGSPQFREAFAGFLKRECGWQVTHENIAVLPSSQTAFFLLFNLLAGDSGGTKRRILYPLVPEYIGYANQGLSDGMLTACRSRLEEHGAHEFKYRVDFDRLKITPDIAAICISCPTNPTGNVLTPDEFDRLKGLAREHGIPLIVDNAYGHPFPDVLYTGFAPQWEEGMIFSISMSKVGLPGVRTAMVVASKEIVRALGNMNAIVSLANGNTGQALMTPLLKDNTLPRVSKEHIRPFYRQRSDFAVEVLQASIADKVPWALHAREGAFFLWLWFKDLPIPAAELYQRLKARKVLVIPGHYFFFGLDEPWEHAHQCLRLTFSQPQSVVQEGLEILADEVNGLH